MATAQSTDNVITLRGSTDIVTEFFFYSINSILYQRGIYPPESFARKAKYGLTMLVTQDEGLVRYLDHVTRQLDSWLMNGKVQRLVVVVTGTDTGEALERWVFNVHNERPALHDANGNTAGGGAAAAEGPPPRKSAKEIHGEIQAIVRQITASVTFLPLLDEPCAFDLLVYADKDAAVPLQWEESDPRYIQNASEVKLRGFSTKAGRQRLRDCAANVASVGCPDRLARGCSAMKQVHQVESMVAFRNGPEDEL